MGNESEEIERQIFGKGMARTRTEDARKLIEKGMDKAFVRDISGLSITEIPALRRKPKR